MRKVLALAGLLTLGSSVSAATPSGSTPSFAAPKSYATGHNPSSVAIGDLNADAKPDLAVGNGRAGTVSVLLNRGDGTFESRRDFVTGPDTVSVAIGDLNDDGKPDLAAANVGANSVSVLLNRGDGSFEAKRDYATGFGLSELAIGDLNDDGKPDLAVANFVLSASSVAVLLNRGDGSFEAKRDYAIGDGPSSIAIGDLNADAKPDLVTANGELDANSVSVLVNDGDGSFQASFDYRTGDGPVSVAIGDLNGDGKPDLATVNLGANTASVLLNTGDGSFRAKRDHATGRRPTSVAIGDLNGDGKPDLATTAFEQASTVSVHANRGDGSFQGKIDYRTGRFPVSVAIGDLNGDGRSDLATANYAVSTVSVLLNAPGLCTVQNVSGKALPAAKRTIARADCRVGKIRRVYSRWVRRGRVMSQKPKPGAVLANRGKVDLVVSRGKRLS